MHRRTVPRTATGTIALGAMVAVLLAGCATTPGEPMRSPSERPPLITTPPLESSPGPTVLPSSGPAPGQRTPVPESVIARPEVQAAITAEAERLAVERDAVEVVAYEAVTWPDGAIGCPEPGKMYPQALVDGHRLILSVAGSEASYHAGSAGTFRYCANPTAPAARNA